MLVQNNYHHQEMDIIFFYSLPVKKSLHSVQTKCVYFISGELVTSLTCKPWFMLLRRGDAWLRLRPYAVIKHLQFCGKGMRCYAIHSPASRGLLLCLCIVSGLSFQIAYSGEFTRLVCPLRSLEQKMHFRYFHWQTSQTSSTHIICYFPEK